MNARRRVAPTYTGMQCQRTGYHCDLDDLTADVEKVCREYELSDAVENLDTIAAAMHTLSAELQDDREKIRDDYSELETRCTDRTAALENARAYLEQLGKDYMLQLSICDPRRRAYDSALAQIDDSLTVQS